MDGEIYYKEMYVNAENPLIINDDAYEWNVDRILNMLVGVFTNEEIQTLKSLDGFNVTAYDTKAAIKFRELLKFKGYDSILYKNWNETPAASIIVFDNSQIFQIAEYVDNGDGTMTEIDIDTSDAENENQYSIPTQASELLERYEKGEISRDEYLAEQQKLTTEGIGQYGKIEPGENPQIEANVPKQVTDDKNVKRFIRTIIETGELSDADLEAVSTDVLLGNFSYDVVSDDSALKYADELQSLWDNALVGAVHNQQGKGNVAQGEQVKNEKPDNWESYELITEFINKVPYSERCTFLRSLANQTNGMKQGEHKNIVISTDTHVYFYVANGYMNGSIAKRSVLTKKANAEIKAWSDNYGSIDTSTKTPYEMAKGYESGRKRNGWDYDASQNSHSKRLNDAMAESSSESNPIGDTWESNGNFKTDEEIITGSIVYKDNGEVFRVKGDGSI